MKPLRPLGPIRAAKLPALLQQLVERLAEMPEKAAVEITWGTDDVTATRTPVPPLVTPTRMPCNNGGTPGIPPCPVCGQPG